MKTAYRPRKEIIAKRIAQLFREGDVVNLGIGLPTLVGNYIPNKGEIILHSENGFLGLGASPPQGKELPFLYNAGAQAVTVIPGACYFDSSVSFGIIRGGHVDYTVLGVLQVDQQGNLANYKIPGKMVPGMGGAMDLLAGAKKVVAATLHLSKDGSAKMLPQCTLPLTAAGEVDYVVSDLGFFSISKGYFLLHEAFAPYNAEDIFDCTDADIQLAEDFQIREIV